MVVFAATYLQNLCGLIVPLEILDTVRAFLKNIANSLNTNYKNWVIK